MVAIKPLYFCGENKEEVKNLMNKLSEELSSRYNIGLVFTYDANELKEISEISSKAGEGGVLFLRAGDYEIVISRRRLDLKIIQTLCDTLNIDLLFIESKSPEREFNVALSKSCMNEYTIATYLESSDYEYVLRRVIEFSKILRIYRKLPGINCRMCGYSSCWDFAVHAARGMATHCPVMGRAVIKVGENTLSLNPFVSRIINSVICSLLKELKSYVPGKVIEIKLYPENENVDRAQWEDFDRGGEKGDLKGYQRGRKHGGSCKNAGNVVQESDNERRGNGRSPRKGTCEKVQGRGC